MKCDICGGVENITVDNNEWVLCEECKERMLSESVVVNQYNKLVRDYIPDLLSKEGLDYKITEITDDEEYKEELSKKLVEETCEYMQDPSKEELADVVEVLDTILRVNHISKDEIIDVAREKREDKGGFDSRIKLIKSWEGCNE